MVVASPLLATPLAQANHGHLMRINRFPPGSNRGPIYASNGFQLAASNGYTIDVVGLQEGESGLPVSLVGVIAKASGVEVEYLVPGVVSENAISAQVGTFGSISMHFQPSGAISSYQQEGCSPRIGRGHEGTWSGTFQFRGEHGYTSVGATKASPIWPRSIGGCSSSSSGGRGRGAWLRSAEGPSSFRVAQNKGPGTATEFEASAVEQQPGLTIRSEIWTSGSAQAFTYDRNLRRATVRPPPPFSGSAEFRRKPGRRYGSWIGSLQASLPSMAVPLRLAGAKFQAALQRGSYEQSH